MACSLSLAWFRLLFIFAGVMFFISRRFRGSRRFVWQVYGVRWKDLRYLRHLRENNIPRVLTTSRRKAIVFISRRFRRFRRFVWQVYGVRWKDLRYLRYLRDIIFLRENNIFARSNKKECSWDSPAGIFLWIVWKFQKYYVSLQHGRARNEAWNG